MQGVQAIKKRGHKAPSLCTKPYTKPYTPQKRNPINQPVTTHYKSYKRSTKEGFKADQQRRHPCLFSIAHRCPRSPCRVKRLRAPASKRLCSSPKRASTPRPFRAIGGRRTAYKNILQKYKTCYGVVKVQKVPGRVTPQNPYCRAPPPRPRGTCSARYAKHKTKHCRIASPKFYGRPP